MKKIYAFVSAFIVSLQLCFVNECNTVFAANTNYTIDFLISKDISRNVNNMTVSGNMPIIQKLKNKNFQTSFNERVNEIYNDEIDSAIKNNYYF